MEGGSAFDDANERKWALTDRRGLLGIAAVGATAGAGVAWADEASATVFEGASRGNVRKFGALGDGVSDDTAAFKKALSECVIVDVPRGRYLLSGTIKLSSGQMLIGEGASGWEPYPSNEGSSGATASELVSDGALLIDAGGTTGARIIGLALMAKQGKQSDWGAPPGFQPGAIGVDLAGSNHFYARDVSFHGLETGLLADADEGRSAQMPQLVDWSAEDCDAVIRFITANKDFYVVRDARIEGCIGAVHCGRVIIAKRCDGLRIENVRFFQCYEESVAIEDTPFVSISGATLFETGARGLVLRNCAYAVISGSQVARSGHYTKGPLQQRTAVSFEGCTDIKFDGLITQPLGRSMSIQSCTNVSVDVVCGTPFWRTGYLGNDDGAIRVERSRTVLLNASFGGRFYWNAVWADKESALTLRGRVVTEGTAGGVRCASLFDLPLGHVVRTRSKIILPPGEARVLEVRQVPIASGHSLVTCCVELSAPGLVFQSGYDIWGNDQEEELGGGSISFARKQLYRNESDKLELVEIPIAVRNTTATSLNIPVGFEVRLSLAFNY
ncbi:glycosyl hydrolase family 28-related protein [Altererythrobacter sp. Z27]|uniref:glycosyl hydrolase family 28-related protein n=1 Tax=Altererythrobacter sp. Z27 TaxID=3461147 RepID=UPI00404497FE